MKTYSLAYKSFEDLINNIDSESITSEQEVLVQVFTSIFDKPFISNLIAEILRIIPQAKIIGTTSNMCIFNAEYVKNTCILSITILDNAHVCTCAIENKCKDSYELGKEFFRNIYQDKAKAMIIFATPFDIEPQELLIGITHSNKEIVISGGIADIHLDNNNISSIASSKRYVFNEKRILENGVAGVCISGDNLFVNLVSNCSWLPIGKEHIITEAKDNFIISIDNTTAADFYSNYIGKENLEVLYSIENQFPLMIYTNDEYLPIPIKKIVNNHIETNIKIPIGTKIKLGYGNMSHIFESIRQKIQITSTLPLETIFIYSCIGRQLFLGDLVNIEMQPLNKELSVNGFFARGEFLYKNGHSSFVSHTATVLCLSENENSRVSIGETKYEIDSDIFNLRHKLLYNIIKSTTDELDDLNVNLERKIQDKIEELTIQYNTDTLTGLPNRIKFLNDLQSKEDCQLAIIDINNFSEVNDFYGNRIGDLLLQSFTEELVIFARTHGLLIYRINSDVFGIIDDLNLSDTDFFNIIVKFYKHITQNSLVCDTSNIYINVNIGISSGNVSVLEKAEMALDHAKHSASNIKVYADDIPMKITYENNIRWITELREAIRDDRIQPFFQGIHNNITGKIEKYETLMRLVTKDGTVIPPINFLDIAKKSGIYTELTKIIINKSFKTFEGTNYDFSINLSVEDIRDPKTRELIYSKLENNSISKRVIFEIVESEDIGNYEEIRDFIEKIHEFGSKIAIDDFGTGYSNFEYVIKLHIDYLKIDGSIIKNITSDTSAELIAETISNFSSKLGIPTIAEFVHNEEVHKRVEKMGLSYSQGYFFSEPSSKIRKKND